MRRNRKNKRRLALARQTTPLVSARPPEGFARRRLPCVRLAEDDTKRHLSLHAAPGLMIRLREGLGKLAPTASRDGASFGCQQRRVARRHLEKVSRLGTIAYRTRLRD